MNVDRVVVTTFPGYFFSTALCLQSIQQHVPGVGVDIVVDDFDLDQWPDYVLDCYAYISDQFPDLDLQFYQFSQIPTVDRARAGGWFRQQLIKLHLDQILTTDRWLVIDADVVLKARPNDNTVPSLPHPPDPVGIGNRLYVKYMLNTEIPWLTAETETEFLCVSGIPIRYITRDLLCGLRARVEQVHNKNFLDLHLDLIAQQQLVAWDPQAQTMVMSEFQLIEYYRNRCYWQSLPIQHGAADFAHTSIKDWNLDQTHFGTVAVPDQYWQKLLQFAQTHH
jgi:hypothetical protein